MALGRDVGDTAFFALAALLLSAMAAWVTRALVRFEVRKHARAAFAAAGRVMSACRGASVDDDVGRIVQSKVEEQAVQQFRSTWAVGAFAGAVFTVIGALNTVLGRERFMTASQQAAHLFLHTVFTVILIFPNLVTRRTIDMFYVAIALGFAATVAPFASSPAMLMMTIFVCDFGVSILVMSRRSVAVTVPTSTLYAVSCSLAIWRHSSPCVDQGLDHGLLGRMPRNLAIGHFVLVMFVTFAGLSLGITIRTLLQQAIRVQTTEELLGAACALLRSVCDVVVELDASGAITRSAHDLGTFLLRGPDFAQQKHRLADLLSNDEDRKMFERMLRAERPSGMALAEALHVHMKDSDRNTLKVEILSFKFKHFDGQPRFMVGLRDFADGPAVGGRAQRPRPEEHIDGVVPTGTQSVPLSDPGSDQESSYGVSVSSQALEAQNDPMRAVVTLDATTQRLEVRGLSAGFQMRLGRLALGTSLLDLVEPGKEQDFSKWVQAAARYGSLWPASRLNLHLRQGRVRASFAVLPESEDDALDPERMQLLVMDVRPITHGAGGGCKAAKPYTDFRGTPREKTMHVTL